MLIPKVIVPVGFDVEADLASQGEHVGACSCPACDQHYFATGELLECTACGFQFPVNSWDSFSKGIGDGRHVLAGARKNAAMRWRMNCIYYRTAYEMALRGEVFDSWDAYRRPDWRTIAKNEVPAMITFDSLAYCERCGMRKKDSSNLKLGLCTRCEAETCCKHRVSFLEKNCGAGVELETISGMLVPCYYCSGQSTNCDKFEPVGISSVVERQKEVSNSISKFMLVGPLVSKIKLEHKGEDWSGTDQCPVCNGVIHLSHAGYNGHVWGKCETPMCLSWAE